MNRPDPDPDPDPDPAPTPVRDRPVTTQIDLERLWRALMGDLGFDGRSLWLMFLDEEGLAAPMLSQVEDLPLDPDDPDSPDSPDGDLATSVVRVLHQVLATTCPGGSAALLLSRPGRGLRSTDRAWARALAREAQRAGLPLWPTHLATDHDLRVIAPDDVVRSA